MQRKKPEDTVRASFRRKYCTPITEVTICDNVNLACFCLLVLLLWFLRAIKRRRPEHVFMIWPTTFFFWRTFCPTFGINWTERIYSLTNLLLLWFICIRFIFCLKKVLLDYSIQVLDQEPRMQDLPWIYRVNQVVFEPQNCWKTGASLIFIYSDRRKPGREYPEWRLRVRLDWDLQPRFRLGPSSQGQGQGHTVILAVPLRPWWFRDQDWQFSDS